MVSFTHRRSLVGTLSLAVPLIACFAFAFHVLAQGGAEPRPTGRSKPTVVITGANRGLGLEFARQFAAADWNVIGTARKPEKADALRELGVRIVPLDVTDSKSIAALAATIGDGSIDLLINNAGVGGRGGSIAKVDFAAIERALQVNTLGPMRVTGALLPSLRRGNQKTIVNISSRLGSIDQNTGGGNYGYRESKAALNMFTRSLAAELRSDGFRCIAMSPGWVRTDMGGPNAPLSSEESIRGMRRVIEGLKQEDSGKFFNYSGEQLPW